MWLQQWALKLAWCCSSSAAPVDLTFAICSIPSHPPPPPLCLPRALVCPHMFSVPSPFAGAAVIEKPGVLLFQRPGSMEREVILGPRRRGLGNMEGAAGLIKNRPGLDKNMLTFTRTMYPAHTCSIYHASMCKDADALISSSFNVSY